jgi:oxidase EvaA
MWMDNLNKKWPIQAEIIPLKDLDPSWQRTSSEISAANGSAISVYQIDVSCATREVPNWDQPIIGTLRPTVLLLLMGQFKGVLHCLVQARLEAGNRLGFELTTTVQNDVASMNSHEQMLLDLARKSGTSLCEFKNSEEGGRFDQCIGEYQICWLEDPSQAQEGLFHRWVSLSQLSDFLGKQNILTNELRSAMSALLAIRSL